VRKISHLLYMNDLKLLDRNKDDLENKIKIVKAISKDINYEFCITKLCKNMFRQRYGPKQKTYRKHI
jgi:hypothetical protein